MGAVSLCFKIETPTNHTLEEVFKNTFKITILLEISKQKHKVGGFPNGQQAGFYGRF
jgi:hypothetical protein